MRTCNEKTLELIPLYIDNELDETDRQFVEYHIETCEACKEELAMYRMIQSELTLENFEVPEGFHQSLMKKITLLDKNEEIKLAKVIVLDREKENRNKKSNSREFRQYINIAAALVFVILLSVIGLTQGNKWSKGDETYTSDSVMSASSETSASSEMSVSSEMPTEATLESSETRQMDSDKADSNTEMAVPESSEEVTYSAVIEENTTTALEESAMKATSEEFEDTKDVSPDELTENKAAAIDVEKEPEYNYVILIIFLILSLGIGVFVFKYVLKHYKK